MQNQSSLQSATLQKKPKVKKEKRPYSKGEEIANAITHGFGVILCIINLVMMIIISAKAGNGRAIVAFSIYGASSICLYLFSTLYHSIPNKKAKSILRVFDHSAIFLFIAGSYTPICLIALEGSLQVAILVGVWSIALGGIIFKVATHKKMDKTKLVSMILYILMGWIVVFAIRPMLQVIPIGFLMWLAGGGIAYTVGTIFYSLQRVPYMHSIWHLFVLAGSVLQAIGIYIYLIF